MKREASGQMMLLVLLFVASVAGECEGMMRGGRSNVEGHVRGGCQNIIRGRVVNHEFKGERALSGELRSGQAQIRDSAAPEGVAIACVRWWTEKADASVIQVGKEVTDFIEEYLRRRQVGTQQALDFAIETLGKSQDEQTLEEAALDADGLFAAHLATIGADQFGLVLRTFDVSQSIWVSNALAQMIHRYWQAHGQGSGEGARVGAAIRHVLQQGTPGSGVQFYLIYPGDRQQLLRLEEVYWNGDVGRRYTILTILKKNRANAQEIFRRIVQRGGANPVV